MQISHIEHLQVPEALTKLSCLSWIETQTEIGENDNKEESLLNPL